MLLLCTDESNCDDTGLGLDSCKCASGPQPDATEADCSCEAQ